MTKAKAVTVYAPADAQHPGYKAIQAEMNWTDIVFSGSPVAQDYARFICLCHGIAHEMDEPMADDSTFKGHKFRDFGRPVRLHRSAGTLLAELGGSLPAPLYDNKDYVRPRPLFNATPYFVVQRAGEYRILTPVAYPRVKGQR